MRRYFRFVTSHPVQVLVVMALPALVLGACILRLERDTSPDAFIPPGHPALLLKREVDSAFGLTEPIVIAVIRDGEGGIFNPQTLGLIRDLTEAVRALPGVEPDDVLSIATESGVYFEDGEPGFNRLMGEVPTDPAELDALREDVLGYELYRGTLVAADGSAACILLRLHDPDRADELYRTLEALVRDFPRTDERIVVAGEAAVRAHMGTAVSDDALRMNIICPLLMGLLIVSAYRTGRGVVLPLCVIGGASALALGSMSVAGVPVYIVTNGIFVVIMALGVADSLHLIGQYYEEQLDLRGRTKQQVIVDACCALWFPLLVTSLTDVAGFFALYLVGVMPPIRYFGLFTCVGVLGALLFSYTVVPAGLAVLPMKMSRAFRERATTNGEPARVDLVGSMMGRLGTLIWRRRGAVLAVGAVVIGVSAWGASKLIVNDARILAFKDHHPIFQATKAINQRFDGTADLNVVVTASQTGAMVQPDLLARIEQLEQFTESLPHVGGTHSVAGWIKRAHQKMHDEDPAYYAIPQDPSDTQFYLAVLGAPGSPMARSLGETIDRTHTRVNLTVRMTSSEFIHQRLVVETLQRHLAERFDDDTLHAKIAGRVYLDYEWLRLIRSTHLKSVCFSFACVLLMTGLMFRSALAGLLCTLTVGLAVLVNYALMGFADIPLGVGTSMFASIAIGAGVNFPIHILDRLRAGLHSSNPDPGKVIRDTLTFTGRALFFTTMVVAVGFLMLCVSEFRTLVRFGLLVGVGMLVSFIASVTLLPAVVAVLKPRSIWPN